MYFAHSWCGKRPEYGIICPGMELWIVVNGPVGAGNQTCPERAVNALNY